MGAPVFLWSNAVRLITIFLHTYCCLTRRSLFFIIFNICPFLPLNWRCYMSDVKKSCRGATWQRFECFSSISCHWTDFALLSRTTCLMASAPAVWLCISREYPVSIHWFFTYRVIPIPKWVEYKHTLTHTHTYTQAQQCLTHCDTTAVSLALSALSCPASVSARSHISISRRGLLGDIWSVWAGSGPQRTGLICGVLSGHVTAGLRWRMGRRGANTARGRDVTLCDWCVTRSEGMWNGSVEIWPWTSRGRLSVIFNCPN